MADHAPLYEPGIHRVTLDALEQTAVSPYPGSGRRAILFRNLGQWLEALKARGVTGRCWLDGSFLTAKLEPGDIDLVLFPNPLQVAPTAQVIAELQRLLDQPYAHASFELDVYIVDPTSPKAVEASAYWRGWFGFCRDGVTAKGIVEIAL